MLQKSITLILVCIALLTACEEPAPIVSSTIITNAVIHNGSGSEAFHGAVRIDGDRIIEIGEIEPLEGETIIDAGGLVLAPGFIDTHNHHDNGMNSQRHMPALLSQGITTIVRGTDGFTDVADREFSGTADTVLNVLNDARAGGVDITADICPYQHWASDLGALNLPDAIHKMTALSAASMGIEHRGRIRTGYYADLVLFDPDTIEDTATMENSTAPSVGIEKVWVNGVLAFDDGEPTLVFAGRVVTRSNN